MAVSRGTTLFPKAVLINCTEVYRCREATELCQAFYSPLSACPSAKEMLLGCPPAWRLDFSIAVRPQIPLHPPPRSCHHRRRCRLLLKINSYSKSGGWGVEPSGMTFFYPGVPFKAATDSLLPSSSCRKSLWLSAPPI